MLIDVAIPGDRNVVKKEAEKVLKYKDLTTEIQCMQNVKTRVIPKLQNGKNTVKTQLYLLAMRGWITLQFTTTCFGLYQPS